jgi:hypothetical protein
MSLVPFELAFIASLAVQSIYLNIAQYNTMDRTRIRIFSFQSIQLHLPLDTSYCSFC